MLHVDFLNSDPFVKYWRQIISTLRILKNGTGTTLRKISRKLLAWTKQERYLRQDDKRNG